MAQAIFETVFDVLYLFGVVAAGIIMLRGSGNNTVIKKFGIMAIILGAGDAFHLVPRMFALWTNGLEANAKALGVGKLVTSVTMTIFYMILYYIWRDRYNITQGRGLSATMWVLAVVRIVLSLLPQNEWLNYNQPLLWGIIRNIPFAIMGIIVIVIFALKSQDNIFRYMWLAVTLSFVFYIPVVLFGNKFPLVGMLMIPKTLAYVWIVQMGWKLFKQKTRLRF